MELVKRQRIRTTRLVRVGGDEDGGALTTMLSILAIVVILGLFTATSTSPEEGQDDAGT